MTDGWVAVIIEDDPDVRDLIDIVFTQSGFRTVLAGNGAEGVEAVRAHDPVLTTLDVNMPGMDGFAVARRLREFSGTYLIMISGMVSEIDVIRGFEAGADDYLVKPFRPRELRARADSMMRRPRVRHDRPATQVEGPAPGSATPGESWAKAAAAAYVETPAAVDETPAPAGTPPPAPASPEAMGHASNPVPPAVATGGEAPTPVDGTLRSGTLAVTPSTGAVRLGARHIEVTPVELALLVSLIETGRRVRSKAELVLTMRGDHFVISRFITEADKRAVDGHIATLRRKLGDDAASPRYIETVRGVGYRMALTA